MEKFQELMASARKKLHVADHILTMTYPIVKDSRLLLAVTENIFLSLSYSMNAALSYEALYKRIEPFPDNFEGKLSVFSRYSKSKNIDSGYLRMIKDVKDIVYQHKKSPIEFSRKDKFVICNDKYGIHSISVSELKGYIAKTKSFLMIVDNIIGKEKGVFREN